MSVRIAIAVMSVALLGACASLVPHDVTAASQIPSSRITVIEKNQVWPAKGLITTNPCAIRQCQEV